MIFQDKVYDEIAELGRNGDCRTVLVRSQARDVMVCKELTEDLLTVYRKLAELKHDHIAQIYGLGIYETKPTAFMEYFPGITLEEKLVQAGSLSLDASRKIMLQICDAVSCFHKAGIVHRDLSSANILINPEGFVKIIDFGISRIYKKNQINDTTLLGTAGFAAPEQFGFAQTDIKTDVYSLGVLLNWMLTGKFPADCLYAGNVEVFALIKKCIHMNPKERCDIGEIEAVIGGRAIHKGSLAKRIIKKIPGFRTGNKVHMTIAIINDAYMLFLFSLNVILLEFNFLKLLRMLLGLMICTIGIGWFIGGFQVVQYHLKINKILLGFVYIIVSFLILTLGFGTMSG